MPRGPSKGAQRMAPHTKAAMPFVKAAIEQGHDVEVLLNDLKTVEEAESYRKGIHNAAGILGFSAHTTAIKGDTGYTFHQAEDGTFYFHFAVHKKTTGRKHVLEKHGTDRSQWPYNPRQPSPRDEAGERTDV